MPTVATRGPLKFVVNTRQKSFEPPHVHVWISNEDLCRIELNGGEFMENPPPGMQRQIMKEYGPLAAAIRAEWDRIHGR
jgi:hypothetical protein